MGYSIMFKVHAFFNNVKVLDRYMKHLPRNGDTIRLLGKMSIYYAKVTEVIWCMDEDDDSGQRINLRLEDL